MTRDALAGILIHLQSAGFAEIAGARLTADVPLPERLINEFLAAWLPPNAPVRAVSVRPEPDDQFSVRITPRTGLIPPVTLRLEIERQPDLPHSPVFVLRLRTLGGLFGFARNALPIGNLLPPGIRLEGEQILVDLGIIATQKGLADLLPFVRQLRVTSEAGRVLLHLHAGV